MPITGDGAFPLRSAWLSNNRRGAINLGAKPRKVVNIAAQNSANAPVWTDFFFASSAPPGIVLTALTGAYTVSGQSAVMARTRELTALAGSYAVTGQTAVLTYGRVLTGLAGSYTVTGQTATLQTARTITALNGSYSVAGQTAAVAVARQITALNGSYALTGQTADVSFGRLLSATNGVYSVAGQAVDISVSGGPAPVTAVEFYVDIRSLTERRRY